MRSTPIDAVLPSPATLLFNRLIRALLCKMNRLPVIFNANDECYEALQTWQDKYINGSDTHKDSFSFLMGSTLAIQCKDGGLWIHGIVEEVKGTDHHGCSYIIRVRKTGRLIVHYMGHIHSTLITTEQYLQGWIKIGTGQLEDIFINAKSVEHDNGFHLYAADTPMQILHNDRWEVLCKAVVYLFAT